MWLFEGAEGGKWVANLETRDQDVAVTPEILVPLVAEKVLPTRVGVTRSTSSFGTPGGSDTEINRDLKKARLK